jgi:Vitamin K-dependent gamma-carboxylase
MKTDTTSSLGLARYWMHGWNRFWFRPGDPTVLGFIRIFCGLMVLYVHVSYSFDLQEFFGRGAWLDLDMANEYRRESPWIAPPLDWSDQRAMPALPSDPQEREQITQYARRWGLDPRVTSAQGNAYFSIWFHVTDPMWMRVVHGGILLIMALFTVGFCTRITSVLTWLAALSYIHRSQITLFGMDTMMSILLFYLMIGPSGGALSVDRWLARRRARRAGTDESLAPLLADRPQPMVSANLAIRLMQVHFCFIYAAAGLSKLLGAMWWNGTALWGTVANPEFAPMRYPFYTEPLRWLCQHRWLWETTMTFGSVYTLVLEISLPFLIWRPRYRGLMIMGSVLLHTGIAYSMGLIGFGLFMLALVMSFIPAETVHELLDGLCGWRQPRADDESRKARGQGVRGGRVTPEKALAG